MVSISMFALLAAGCGRSAPEAALPASEQGEGEVGDGVEPELAGVQITSDVTVVPPAPTTAAPLTSTTAPAMTDGTTYEVQPGDTLSVIAEQFGIGVDALSAANGITDVNSIRPGQQLIIPAAG